MARDLTAHTTWHGFRFSPAMRDCVAEWERLAQAEKIPFTVTQGGFNVGGVKASAGTHDGDAVDVSVRGLTQQQVTRLIEIGRMLGLALWLRTANTPLWGVPAQRFVVAHLHGVPNGWGVPSNGAKHQAVMYRQGRDGLARNGPDTGPGHTSAYRTRTWPEYQKTNTRTDIERFLAAMDEKQLRKIIGEEVDRALWRPLVPGRKDVGGSSIRNVLLHIYLTVTKKAGK